MVEILQHLVSQQLAADAADLGMVELTPVEGLVPADLVEVNQTHPEPTEMLVLAVPVPLVKVLLVEMALLTLAVPKWDPVVVAALEALEQTDMVTLAQVLAEPEEFQILQARHLYTQPEAEAVLATVGLVELVLRA
jgi:hypothetical protein